MRDAYVITGQTATGKTSHALQLALKVGGELISVDSRQIYQKLDIITGKDIPNDSKFTRVEDAFPLDDKQTAQIGYYAVDGVKVWGLDLISIHNRFSAHDFRKVCESILEKYISPTTVPIFVGGTYFYLKALLYGFGVDVAPQWGIRKELEKLSIVQLQNKFRALDAASYEKLNNSDRNNPHRLIRRIEIFEQGSSSSQKIPLITPLKMIGFKFSSSEKLKKHIENRVQNRLDQGAVKEVQHLLDIGYSADDPGLKTIGYQEIISHLKGEITLDAAIEQWIYSEMHYAKRQVTFMKSNSDIEWTEV
jgi:tRNA dimethylallyltransferase